MLIAISATSAKPLTHVAVELKWFHQVQFAGIYAAKEKGFYRQAGLDVNIIERNPKSNPIKDVLAGKVEFGVSDSTLVKEKLSGKPLVLLAAIFQHSPLVLISLEKNKIISPLEVKGKTVMYQKGVDDAIILAMFKEFGIDEKDFVFVPHNFDNDALISDVNNVAVMSAYLSNQPYLYQEKGYNLNIIKPQSYGIDFYGDMIFTSEKFFKANKGASLAFRAATIKGWQYALKHPDEVYQWLSSVYPSKKSSDALRYEMDVTKRMIVSEHIDVGYISASRLANIAQLYKRRNPEWENSTLHGLYYKDHDKKSKHFYFILYFFLIVIGVLVLILISLFIFNRRLKTKIKEHTEVIDNANNELHYYFSMLNKHVCLLYLDTEAKITDCSIALCNFLDVEKNQLVKQSVLATHIFDFYSSEDKQKFMTALREHLFLEGEVVAKSGVREHVMQFTLTSSELIHMKDNAAIIILNDITDKKDIEKMSITDTVSELANRLHLERLLQQEIAGAARYAQALSIIMFDLDHFKKINDTLGHNIGDELLKQVGDILKGLIRDVDVAGRWGGDEFVVICRNSDASQIAILAEKIRSAIADVSIYNIPITASFGVAAWVKGNDEKQLIHKADNALYQAKNNGRNSVVVYAAPKKTLGVE